MSLTATGVLITALLAEQQTPAFAEAHQAPPIDRLRASQAVAATYAPAPAPIASVPPAVAESALSIAAPADGTVQLVYVRLGERVDAGQPLLTFDDRQSSAHAAQLRLDVAAARERLTQLQGELKTLDDAIAAAAARVPDAPVSAPMPPEAAAAVTRAQSIYNEAVARERRASALIAHGVAAAQELEDAQVGVKNAAEALALARREADAKAELASAQALDARAQAESAVTALRGQRAQLAAEFDATRQRQREAEAALAEATADSAHLVLRAPAPAVVTGLAIEPGDRAVAGSPLLKLDRISPHESPAGNGR